MDTVIYEHYIWRYYDFARESYRWKAYHSLKMFGKLDVRRKSIVT